MEVNDYVISFYKKKWQTLIGEDIRYSNFTVYFYKIMLGVDELYNYTLFCDQSVGLYRNRIETGRKY